jgi:hypothetical protein
MFTRPSFTLPGLCRLALACAALTASSAAPAFCGFFAGRAGASLFNEASQVILVRDGHRSVISMLNDFKGPLTDFALVVPVPQVLERGQVRIGDKALFDRLDAYSSPRLAEYFDPDPCPDGRQRYEMMARGGVVAKSEAPALRELRDARAKALGVAVEASYTVGEYDIVMLSAKQSQGLETWLLENGYRMPPGAAAALAPYVAQEMKFFVAKVNLKEQAATGVQYLRPLQFAFESEKFMLPLRLGMINAAASKPQELIAYMLTRGGRVESANYRTVKLPANENLPPAIKRDFKGFYKAMFDHQSRVHDHRVVFTEYFWDMGWCDPCAADPLSAAELQQAGVFWLDADAGAAGAAPNVRPRPRRAPGGAQNALLTRLHVRYTPQTFPEDLMFVQTADRANWQTRYVVQQPFQGSVQACREKSLECETGCSNAQRDGPTSEPDQPSALAQCILQCQSSQRGSIEQARRYYEIDLPQRRSTELQTLRRYTGWSAEEAQRYAGLSTDADAAASSGANVPWWQRLFGNPPGQTPRRQ